MLPDCKKEVELKVQNNRVSDYSGNNVYIYHENVTMETDKGCFHNNGVIVISRFSNAYIGAKLEVVVQFELGPVLQDGQQAIVYNGDCGFSPSVAIVANRTDLTFLLRNEQNFTRSIAVPISQRQVMDWLYFNFKNVL